MTLFEVNLSSKDSLRKWCVDLDTISSFYIGQNYNLYICPNGGNTYLNPICLSDTDAERLLDTWRNRDKGEHI